jgi:glutamine synthetase
MTELGDERLAERGAALGAELARDGVAGIACTTVDTSGIARVKGVPVARLGSAAVWGVGLSPVFDVMLLDDSVTSAPGTTGPVGDLRLVPDLDSIVALAAQPGWAWSAVDRFGQDGTRHPGCGRGFASRMVDVAARRGLSFEMAFEVEWMLGRGDTGDDPAAPGQPAYEPAVIGPAYGTNRLVTASDYGRDLLDALAQQGIEVEQFHPEYSTSQFEVSVAPAAPVQAADRNVLVRQTIRAVSERHGYRATFAPAVVPGEVGNGHHLHYSLWRDGRDLMSGGPGPEGLTVEGASFLAGVLHHLPSLLAIGAPSVASYLRLQPEHWAGDFQCWGLENREAAVRLVAGPVRSGAWAANAELKCIDASANSYLVVGAVIAAGLDGIDCSAVLPAALSVDPGGLDDSERAAAGVLRLPTDLTTATDRLAEDRALGAALGSYLAGVVDAVRRAEVARFADADAATIAAFTRWRH